ncbi:carbohydrate deacetylase [Candidatus Margulisiibacteriota bacterium]
MKEKKLIVTADDFGSIESTNQAIMHCYHHGLVRSASLMAVGSAFEQAVTLAKATPGLSIGAHLTLVNEKPVLAAKEIPSLVNQDGYLHYSYKVFMKKYFLRQINLDEVERELHSQITKVINRGIKIDYLNSHQHIHLLPEILRRVIKLAQHFNIECLRFPKTSILNLPSLRQAALHVLASSSKKLFKSSGLKTTDHFLGFSQSGRISEGILVSFLNDLEAGISEIVMHPTFEDQEYLTRYKSYYDKTGFKHQPEKEIAALTSKSVKQFLIDKNIKLINFSELCSSKLIQV